MIAHALPLWVGGKRWARIVFKTMSAWIVLYDLEKLLWNERVTWHARQCLFGCSPSKHNEISCCIFFLRVSRNILMMFHIVKTIEFTVACEQRVPTFPSNFRVTDAWNQTHVLVTRGKMRGISSEIGRTQHHQLKSGKYMRSNPWAGVLWRLSAMARRGHRPRRHRQ